MSESVRDRELTVLGHPARVFEGGEGAALLLLHGGWGGAALHWSRVWERLAAQFHVVAPDLPGLGSPRQPALASVREYVDWLLALLEVLGLERVHCVGNSFGGSVAWSLAGRAPERCANLVLVNALPMPRTPAPLLWAGRTALGEALMRVLVGRVSYHPSALERAFVEPSFAPPELAAMLSHRGAVLLPRFTRLLVAGDGPPVPQVAPFLLWGEGDRLFGTQAKDARRLHASWPGSSLHCIPAAGHFPQLEAPKEFVRQLTRGLR